MSPMGGRLCICPGKNAAFMPCSFWHVQTIIAVLPAPTFRGGIVGYERRAETD